MGILLGLKSYLYSIVILFIFREFTSKNISSLEILGFFLRKSGCNEKAIKGEFFLFPKGD